MGFRALNLHDSIVKAVVDAGYESPTQVQAEAVPAAIEGRDLLVSSRTGSGKTAAFMLPALHRMAFPARAKARGPRVLVLTPTRELAQQVTQATIKYGRHLRHAKAVSIVGGVPYPVQNRLLAQPYEVLVATPGRLMDQMKSGRIDFGRLETLVLDEADRMLDMGFIEDIEHILSHLPKERQTLLFSATVDERIARLASNMLDDPLRISIESTEENKADIEQRLLYADDLSHKNQLLDFILRDAEVKQAIVFTATKRDAEQLAIDLDEAGLGAAALHGDMGQGQRNRTLMRLRRGDLRVLVATDVAARGIDVSGISHVVNFDLPKSVEDYVHRIGRTGRAGRSGIAISFANRREVRHVQSIERFTKSAIPVHTLPGLEPKIPVFDKPRRSSAPRGQGGQRGQGGGYRGQNGGGAAGEQRPYEPRGAQDPHRTRRGFGDSHGHHGEARPYQERPRYEERQGGRYSDERSGAPQDRRPPGARDERAPRHGEERRPFPGNRDERPRFNQDRPRQEQDRPRYGDDRPRFTDDRPRHSEDRPRFNSDRPAGERKPYGDRPPRREGGFGGGKPFKKSAR